VPTIAESGLPGFDHGPWNGLLAPAQTPRAVIAKLNALAVRIVHSPEVKKVLNHEGAKPVGNTPEEFTAVLKSETAKWAKVVKAAGIKVE
jgi:tripartite-type tricarboxylate transporter receptor subunit TctC